MVRFKLALKQRENHSLSNSKSYSRRYLHKLVRVVYKVPAPQKNSFIPRGMRQMLGLSHCWGRYLPKVQTFMMV